MVGINYSPVGGMSLAKASDSANNPPVWDSQPLIDFNVGTSKSYDMDDITSDPDSDPITFSMNTGTVSLPTGVTWTPSTGILAYNGVAAADLTTGHIITLDDGTDTTDSNAFNITISEGLDYPRFGSVRIGERVYAEDNTEGETERAAIALGDVVWLGLFSDGPWDNSPNAAHLSRSDIIDDLKTRNPDLIIFDYTDVGETSLTSDTGAYALTQTGPGGTDWFTYADADNYPEGRVSTYPNSYNVNITTYVTPDGSGKRYPEVYGDYKQGFHIDPVAAGVGVNGVNIYNDVMDIRPRTNSTDINGDGTKDNARSYYDPENEDHVAQQGGLSVTISQAWRQGQANFVQQLIDDNSGILIAANLTTWSREYVSTNEADAPAMLSEYVNLVHGGHCEGQSLPETGYPFSGVYADGNSKPGDQFGKWQRAHNSYTYCLDNCITLEGNDAPFVLNEWHVELSPSSGSLPDSPEGRQIYTTYPTGGAFNLVRWGLCSTLMENGYHAVATVNPGSSSGNYSSTPQFDEYGTANTGTTGLSKGWLGQPIDPPQRSPWYGDIYKREFDNGLVLLHIEHDDSTSDHNINVTGEGGIGAGVWKRIDGVQDDTWNDGSTINADFTIPPIDGIILERI